MGASDIMNLILEHFNIQNLVSIDMEITKNASGALKQTNMHLPSRSNSMMLILNLINFAVSQLLLPPSGLNKTEIKSLFSAMDKLHIYRENTKSFGGQSNRFMSRIGRICGGQAKVRH